MYENGMRKNLYSNKRKHIDEQKKKFLKQPFSGSSIGMSFEQYLSARDHDEQCEQYWKTYYITGRRQYAKEMTSNVIRSNWRNKVNYLLLLEDEEFDDADYSVGSKSDYQKYFDYNWTIW